MDVRIDTTEPSLTAVVVVEPMDLSRLMDCFDRVYRAIKEWCQANHEETAGIQ